MHMHSINISQLAIVSMSDQYTRITTGGSPLPKTEPVVGLLFGRYVSETNNLSVTDAEDVPINRSEKATTQVRLHQAVFPQHSVVGWYRVTKVDDAPTPEDLLLSEQLKKHYQEEPDETSTTTTTTTSNPPFLFTLLQVKDETKGKDEDEDDELPLQIFKVDSTHRVLVGFDNDWKLDTATAERIAVERVMKEQPPSSTKNNNGDTGGEKLKQPPKFVAATLPIQQSVAALQDRLAVVEDFLTATAHGTIPLDPALLRQVQGLLLSVGPMAAAATAANSESSTSDATSTQTTSDELLQQLTVLAQTVTAVQQYTDKVRAVHDTGGGGARRRHAQRRLGKQNDDGRRCLPQQVVRHGLPCRTVHSLFVHGRNGKRLAIQPLIIKYN